ncbi:MAG: hypothetical protein ACRD4H_13455 [Candidatus Acidiferrales bacterium]
MDGMFPRTDFAYDAEHDIYICPNGKPLRTSGIIHDGHVRNYLSRANGSKALDDMGVRTPVEEIVSNLVRLGVVDAANLKTAHSR